jgi:hypothetical protein
MAYLDNIIIYLNSKEEHKCKSIYIRSRRACDKFASTLCLFGRMATWGGTRYNKEHIKWVLRKLYKENILVTIKKYKFYTRKTDFIIIIIKLK